MPSTARYRFEYRLFDWAEDHIRNLAGERVAFFVACRQDGTLRRIYVAAPYSPWDQDQRASMADAHPRWFLFVPGTEPGRGYIEWCELPVSIARRWLGRPMLDADFQAVTGGEPLQHWPDSWTVTF
ncbi:MAG: hypothetical protein KC656_15205 [Myxococcales bacterium]|nr:hypothetical protein [Myxococcales bacterium]MCB9668243.1 hypothetical protein [Alphaproteobacteria bacterium]MCB9692583.1 hypothetical protein [Alphaproteobacteria bacterium]